MRASEIFEYKTIELPREQNPVAVDAVDVELIGRLKKMARDADAGKTTDVTDMTRDELRKLLF